ncbi:hypothetical protein GM418_05675 [Maribellus comscasis]|uniref:Uncharacterized protein n=1 Tax=Maribellus comscasis TaxID=2681766 RepID=A0A6I6JZU2_9BACT|nr:hypothetical protein [Maribellus comscasis]QGY43164.1 hypothetical protein GM418_05675 [Maribellus comscasis]
MARCCYLPRRKTKRWQSAIPFPAKKWMRGIVHSIKIQKVKPWHFAQSYSDAKTNSGIVLWFDNPKN